MDLVAVPPEGKYKQIENLGEVNDSGRNHIGAVRIDEQGRLEIFLSPDVFPFPIDSTPAGSIAKAIVNDLANQGNVPAWHYDFSRVCDSYGIYVRFNGKDGKKGFWAVNTNGGPRLMTEEQLVEARQGRLPAGMDLTPRYRQLPEDREFCLNKLMVENFPDYAKNL